MFTTKKKLEFSDWCIDVMLWW